MPLIELASTIRKRNDCWFPNKLNNALAYLQVHELKALELWVNTYVFEEALKSKDRKMNVTTAIRRFCPSAPDWTGTALQPLYDRTGKDEKYAAMMYGNLACRVAVHRSDFWICFGESVRADGDSRTYMEDAALYNRMLSAT